MFIYISPQWINQQLVKIISKDNFFYTFKISYDTGGKTLFYFIPNNIFLEFIESYLTIDRYQRRLNKRNIYSYGTKTTMNDVKILRNCYLVTASR